MRINVFGNSSSSHDNGEKKTKYHSLYKTLSENDLYWK